MGKVLANFIVTGMMLSLAGGVALAEGQEVRNVELILDASGSMNARLAGGQSKLAAAKAAVDALVGKLPDSVNLAFRAYGHQSPRSQNNCHDTSLLVPFGRTDNIKRDVVSAARGLRARGYTPITYVLGLAVKDLKNLAGSKTIVLVSDGKETCQGDPCALAAQLAEANIDLVIHTVGFGADMQTKTQLQCIANAARGKYFNADSATELVDSIAMATSLKMEPIAKVPPKTEKVVIKIKKPEFGFIKLENGKYTNSHDVFDSETQKELKPFYASDDYTVKLKPGTYDVKIGNNVWYRNVKVKGNETVVIRPGLLSVVKHKTHRISDAETDKEVAILYSSDTYLALPPGTYKVQFEETFMNFTIKAGEETVVNPGMVKLFSQPETVHEIYFAGSKKLAGRAWKSSKGEALLAPGSYYVTIFDQKIPFKVTEGRTVEIRLD